MYVRVCVCLFCPRGGFLDCVVCCSFARIPARHTSTSMYDDKSKSNDDTASMDGTSMIYVTLLFFLSFLYQVMSRVYVPNFFIFFVFFLLVGCMYVWMWGTSYYVSMDEWKDV